MQTLAKQSSTGHHQYDVWKWVGMEAWPEDLMKGKNMQLQNQSIHQKSTASYSET
jgi:hypothetical protein